MQGKDVLARSISIAAILFGIGCTWSLGDTYLTASPFGLPIYVVAAVLVSWICYVVAFVVWTWKRRDASLDRFSAIAHAAKVNIAAAVLSVITAFAVAMLLYPVESFLYHGDPIGQGNDVARPPCQTHEVAHVPNRHGVVADVRETYCGGDWDGNLMYFVFVRRASEQNTRQNLAFRYWADTLPNTTPPKVSWASPTKLRISARPNVLEITEQRFTIAGTSIGYDLREKRTASTR